MRTRTRAAALLAGAAAAAALVPTGPAVAGPVERGTGVVCPADRLPPLPYRDLPAGSAAAPAVACVLGLGVARGTTSTTYAPDALVTRGQMAVFLLRAAARAGSAPPAHDPGYRDLAGATPEVRDAVGRLAGAGVVRGYADGTYRPQDVVARDQMAAFLVRLQGLVGGPQPPPADCFTDTAGSAHAPDVGTVCALGVAVGDGAGHYAPAAPVLRRQMASFLARLLDVDAEAGLVAPLPVPPAYAGGAYPADPARLTASWHEGCPVPVSDLRRLEVTHWGFDGTTHTGELVVHADAAQAVVDAFGALYRARVPVERVRPVDEYGGDDERSMAANNTSAFNCRTVAGTTTWSRHAYGRAVDVDPVQNPYVSSGGAVDPPAGAAYLRRDDVRPGMAVADGPLVQAFRAVGWGWGGDFRSAKDYQHFSADGR